jgi:hypothetical protein
MAGVLRLALEIEETEPISGTLRDHGELTLPFSGWLGLISILERLRLERDEDNRRATHPGARGAFDS